MSTSHSLWIVEDCERSLLFPPILNHYIFIYFFNGLTNSPCKQCGKRATIKSASLALFPASACVHRYCDLAQYYENCELQCGGLLRKTTYQQKGTGIRNNIRNFGTPRCQAEIVQGHLGTQLLHVFFHSKSQMVLLRATIRTYMRTNKEHLMLKR